jgi:hypothetical protein
VNVSSPADLIVFYRGKVNLFAERRDVGATEARANSLNLDKSRAFSGGRNAIYRVLGVQDNAELTQTR